MHYMYELNSVVDSSGDLTKLGRHISLHKPWVANFWLGGWDADALCGFCKGNLLLPAPDESIQTAQPSMRRIT